MTRRAIAFVLPSVLALAVVASAGVAADNGAPATRPTVSSSAASSLATSAQSAGRYKKDGDNCIWTAGDRGPNQCEPLVKGRFRRGPNNACTWDAAGLGTDQCRPSKGRWKKGDGDACAWDATDNGPDQCNPHRAK